VHPLPLVSLPDASMAFPLMLRSSQPVPPRASERPAESALPDHVAIPGSPRIIIMLKANATNSPMNVHFLMSMAFPSFNLIYCHPERSQANSGFPHDPPTGGKNRGCAFNQHPPWGYFIKSFSFSFTILRKISTAFSK